MSALEQNPAKFQEQLPLVSKMRGKQKLWGKSSHDITSIDKENGQCMPLNMAIEETRSKGSLLDRIASLEDRLVELYMEIESYKKSLYSSSTDKSSGASSSSGSKTERICSYPTFDIRNPQSKGQLPRAPINTNIEFEENTNGQQEQRLKISSSTKQQHRGKKRDRKTGRNGKNNDGPSWPHLKLLGC